MKKIGIITFHTALNYGAVLQAYALQHFIKDKFNADADIIDYACPKLKNDYSYFKNNPNRSFLFNALRSILDFKNKFILKSKYKKFTDDYLNLSKLQYDKSTIRECADSYDLIITGSDQVWNLDLTDYDTVFFLDFLNSSTKKASYAASFGFYNSFNEHQNAIIDMLSDFKGISLRENIGADILEKSGLQPHVHLDPSFLLPYPYWDALSAPSPMSEKYILLFTVLEPVELINFTAKLAKRMGLKIVYLTSSLKNYQNIAKITDAGPCQFLSLIKNAEYVCTTSFHGLAFSIIFHKKFFTETKSKSKKNYRINSLLNLLNLKNRDISEHSVNLTHLPDIHWSKVDDIISAEKNRSFLYLKEIIVD